MRGWLSSLGLLALATLSACDQEPPVRLHTGTGTFAIPASFIGPRTLDNPGLSRSWGYLKPHANGGTGSLLQITEYPMGISLDARDAATLRNVAQAYLRQFLYDYGRRYGGFTANALEDAEIDDLPAVFARWSGVQRGRAIEGVLFTVYVDDHLVSMLAQDFVDSQNGALDDAEQVFRSADLRD